MRMRGPVPMELTTELLVLMTVLLLVVPLFIAARAFD